MRASGTSTAREKRFQSFKGLKADSQYTESDKGRRKRLRMGALEGWNILANTVVTEPAVTFSYGFRRRVGGF